MHGRIRRTVPIQNRQTKICSTRSVCVRRAAHKSKYTAVAVQAKRNEGKNALSKTRKKTTRRKITSYINFKEADSHRQVHLFSQLLVRLCCYCRHCHCCSLCLHVLFCLVRMRYGNMIS